MLYLSCSSEKESRATLLHLAMEAWLRSSVLQHLVRASGEEMPDSGGLQEMSLWLQEFSKRWDYRALHSQQQRSGAPVERWLVQEDGNLTSDQIDLVAAAAETLGLIGVDTPQRKYYDYVLVLGGARLSNLLRARHASQLLSQGIMAAGKVILLGCMRPVADAERETTDTYAPRAATEYDLLNSGAEHWFDLSRGYDEERHCCPENLNVDWAIRSYRMDVGDVPVLSLAAPSSEPEKRRANSADTFSFLLSRCGVNPGDSLLLITSQIYVPYQQMEAMRMLAMPHDLVVETVGHPVDWSGNVVGMRQWSNYLQEIRSTIISIDRFLKQYPPEPAATGKH